MLNELKNVSALVNACFITANWEAILYDRALIESQAGLRAKPWLIPCGAVVDSGRRMKALFKPHQHPLSHPPAYKSACVNLMLHHIPLIHPTPFMGVRAVYTDLMPLLPVGSTKDGALIELALLIDEAMDVVWYRERASRVKTRKHGNAKIMLYSDRPPLNQHRTATLINVVETIGYTMPEQAAATPSAFAEWLLTP